MGGFFRGWKRKVGVLTLLMSCGLVGEWVRSLYIVDSVDLSCGMLGRGSFLSVNGLFAWSIGFEDSAFFRWKTVPLSEILIDGSMYFHDGFAFGESSFGFNGSRIPVFIPYCVVVIPLSLLSAWLLLSKPQKLNPMKLTEPISQEVK